MFGGNEPIELGFEGEGWNHSLGILVIPVPGLKGEYVFVSKGDGNDKNKDKIYIINKTDNGHSEWEEIDDLLILSVTVGMKIQKLRAGHENDND